MGDLTIIEVTTSTFAPTAAPTVAAAAAEEDDDDDKGVNAAAGGAIGAGCAIVVVVALAVWYEASRRGGAKQQTAAVGPHAGRRQDPGSRAAVRAEHPGALDRAVRNRLSRLRFPDPESDCGVWARSDEVAARPVDSATRIGLTRRRAFPYPPSPRNQDLAALLQSFCLLC